MDVQIGWALALIALLALAAWLAFDISLTRWGRETREEFEQTFPGKCCYCSLIEYGIREGHEPRDATPKPHPCPEKMERFRKFSV